MYVGPGTKFRFTENAALGPVTNKVTAALALMHEQCCVENRFAGGEAVL